MPKAIFSFPVKEIEWTKLRYEEGWPESWSNQGFGPIKQVLWLGNKRYSRAKVRTLMLPTNPVILATGVQVTRVVLVSNSKNLRFAVVFVDYEVPFHKLAKFLKIGNQANQEIFQNKLGVTLDTSTFVNATCILNDNSSEPRAIDGLLYGQRGKSDFYFEVAYGLGVAAITAERINLEHATIATFKPGIFAARARKALALTENWLGIPTSDSTQILQEFELLRESLRLSQRMNQVRRSLTHQTNYVNKLFGYAISLSTLSATVIATAVVLDLDLIAASYFIIGVIGSSVISATLWWLLRNRRG